MSSDRMLPDIQDIVSGVNAALKMGGVPDPVGWAVLVAMPDYRTKTKGGIELPTDYVDREETAAPIGYVVKLGPDCFTDNKRFPSGPRCKPGDFVLFKSYSGLRVKVHGKEFRYINDDTVQAVVADPSFIERV